MAGIYIHIPFCHQKCNYCDFYKTLNTKHTKKFLSVLHDEAVRRKKYLNNEHIETIYFGGGTPSVLKQKEIDSILHFLNKEFYVKPNAEVTFEANPDDLDLAYLEELFAIGINRLSIGIQSFQNDHLKKMNRRHDAGQAVLAVENAFKAGFKNISADLIYGLPGLTEKQWQFNLDRVFQLPVQHLSAYHLTYHKGTPFDTWIKKGELRELGEKESVDQFNMLIETAEKNDFEHYEISNFAKEGQYSKHNTSYWTGKNYLGLGPSAHSFNGFSRQWNFSDIERYLKAFENDLPFFENEILTENEKYNEYILTRIRTKWGVSVSFIEKEFGMERVTHFLRETAKYLKSNQVIQQNETFTLSRAGLFISDEIMTNLMII